MNRFLAAFLLIGTTLALFPGCSSAQPEPLPYPVTRQLDQVDTYHGTSVADPYQWMEDVSAPEMNRWIAAQDSLTRQFADAAPARADLEKRIQALQEFDRYGIPLRRGGTYFWNVTRAGADQPVLYRQARLDAPPQVVLDPHAHPHFQEPDARFGWATYSLDGQRMAYRVGKGQSRWGKVYVLDVKKGTSFPEVLVGVRGTVAWNQAGDGFYYVRYKAPEPGQELNTALVNAKIYYHRVGTPQATDQLIYARPQDPTWTYGVRVTNEGRYLVVSATPGGSFSGMVDYLFYKDLQTPGSEMVQLFGGTSSTYGFEGNQGQTFWIRTDHEAPNAKLVAVDLNKPAPEHWQEVIPEAEEVLNTISVTGPYFIARYTRDARPVVKVFDVAGAFKYELDLPGLGSVGGLGDNPEGAEAFYSMNVLYDPGTIYRLDVATGKSEVFRRAALPYNPDDFEGKQVFFTSKDGTRVPMFIIHKKGLALNGDHPVFQYAYGAYAWVAFPWFQPPLVAWLEMGGIYALPNIRGGGEYGEAWHQAGIRAEKQNAIDDYIAATEWLIDNNYTRPARMVANGGSASGPLAAAAIIQRPDLYGAAVIDIPNLDLLRAHLFPGGPNRVAEFGSSENADEFEALHAYSPYHNIETGVCYPPTVVTVGSKDEVAYPSHGYKFVARMQAAQGCAHPVLLNVAWEAGHSYGITPAQRAETWSENLSFLIQVLDLEANGYPATPAGQTTQ